MGRHIVSLYSAVGIIAGDFLLGGGDLALIIVHVNDEVIIARV